MIIDRGYGSPTISDDGVTVAKAIELENKFENIGASLIQEVANRTNEGAGDGTTTATVLAQKMIEEAFGVVAMNSAKSNDIKRGVDKAVAFVVRELQSVKKEVKNQAEIEQVATIASLDPEVGKLIAEAMHEVGNDGVITVEEGQTIGLQKEVVKGMRFDRGFISQYMITNTDRMEAVWDNPAVLVTDRKISSVQDVLPLLEKLIQSGKKDLVIIAEDVDGEALTTFILNKLRGVFNVLAIKAPAYGDRRKEMLGDIAVLTGATVITDELGLKLDKAELEQLGTARKVIATKEHSTIVDGAGDAAAIAERVALIKAQHAAATSDFDKEKFTERLARLAGGVGVIKVGAFTETEMKAKKFKIEDALNATKAAVEEGIVAGGGTALAKIAPKLDSFMADMGKVFPNEIAGVKIVRKALEAPIRQIAENVGVEASGIVAYVQTTEAAQGYNFAKYIEGNWENGKADMFAEGIVDPLKVTRLALENAASIASTLLTAEAIIVDKPEHDKPAAGAGGGGMGGMPGMDY